MPRPESDLYQRVRMQRLYEYIRSKTGMKNHPLACKLEIVARELGWEAKEGQVFYVLLRRMEEAKIAVTGGANLYAMAALLSELPEETALAGTAMPVEVPTRMLGLEGALQVVAAKIRALPKDMRKMMAGGAYDTQGSDYIASVLSLSRKDIIDFGWPDTGLSCLDSMDIAVDVAEKMCIGVDPKKPLELLKLLRPISKAIDQVLQSRSIGFEETVALYGAIADIPRQYYRDQPEKEITDSVQANTVIPMLLSWWFFWGGGAYPP